MVEILVHYIGAQICFWVHVNAVNGYLWEIRGKFVNTVREMGPIVVIAVEPAGKPSFVYSYMQWKMTLKLHDSVRTL